MSYDPGTIVLLGCSRHNLVRSITECVKSLKLHSRFRETIFEIDCVTDTLHEHAFSEIQSVYPSLLLSYEPHQEADSNNPASYLRRCQQP